VNAGHSAFQTVARAIAFAALGVVATLAFAPSSAAQEHVRVTIDQVVLGGHGAATAYLSALDSAGRPVRGIIEVDASVDGEAADVVSVAPVVSERIGVSVLLVLDISGSMEGEPITRAKEAAATFAGGLLPADAAALLPFAGVVPPDIAFTSDRAELVLRINGLVLDTTTGTAVYDAVAGSLAAIARAPNERRAIIFLTDGQDYGGASHTSREDAAAAAGSSGVPFYTVGLGSEVDVAFLQDLADRSGGTFYQVPQPAALPRMFEEIGNALRSQYAVTFQVPASQSTERELLVGVEIAGQRYAVRYAFQAPAVAVPSSGSSGASPPYPLIAAAIATLVGVVTVLYVVRRRRRRRSAVEPGPGADDAPLPAPETPRFVSTSLGRLSVVAGPNAGAGVALSTGAITLGSDPACELRLDQANGSVAAVHVRVWLEHDRLMLHHLAKRARTIVGDRSVDWATLEANDTLQIGPHIIVFALDSVT